MHHEILHDAGAILPCVHEADVRRVAAVQRPLAKIIAESGVAHALGVKGQQAQAVPAGERRLIALLPQHLELPCGRVKKGGAALAAVGRQKELHRHAAVGGVKGEDIQQAQSLRQWLFHRLSSLFA